MFGRRGGQPLQRDWDESSDGGASIESSDEGEDDFHQQSQLRERRTSREAFSPPQRPQTSVTSASEPSDLRHKKRIPENIKTMERISTLSLFRSAILPILNILLTCALIGILIYVFLVTDGQRIDFTLSNIPPSTLVSLIMTLLTLLLSGGIAFALSEYKWFRFQRQNSSLSFLDTYDACARGVGGALRVLPYLRFDLILIAAIIFNLGLIAMGPAAQSLLHTTEVDYCVWDTENASLPYNSLTINDATTYNLNINDPRTIRGVKNDYVVAAAVTQVLKDLPLMAAPNCPSDALNCSYYNVPTPHTELNCNIGSINTTQIVDIHHNNVTTIHDYEYTFSFDSPPSIMPRFYYHGSMLGRTYYDLMNMTFEEHKSSLNTTYDPVIRRGIGEQKFVMLTFNDTMQSSIGDVKDLVVRECTLNSFVNNTDFAFVRNKTLTRENQTLPVTLDYDQLGNNTFWMTSYPSIVNYTTMNTYAFQISILKTIILGNEDYFNSNFMYGIDKVSTDEFFRRLFKRMGLNFALLDPAQFLRTYGYTCYAQIHIYQLDPAAYFTLSLVLLLPLVCWVLTWIVSLHQLNGVSRGQSQVALLITSLTAAARERVQGLSQSDQYTMLSAASKVTVRYGERTQSGSAKFGLPDEVIPIAGSRRRSI